MKYTIHLLTTLSILLGFIATAHSFPVFVERENVPVEKKIEKKANKKRDAKQKHTHTSKQEVKKQNTPAKADKNER